MCAGTLNVARAALASGTREFVLISTDKAVNPTNVMGASKRLAEVACQAVQATGFRHPFCHGALRQCAGFVGQRDSAFSPADRGRAARSP
jgi:dTDP-4-dehydrorhamnose reductase